MPDPYSMMYFTGGNPAGQPGTPGNRAPGGAINPIPSFGWNPGYGGIPAVPNPTTTAGSAITGNTANFGGASNLAALTNLFNQQQQQQQLIRGLPQYSSMVNTSSANILSNLRGQIPQDVLRQLETTAAERGIGTGTAGSPSGNAALLRALGLNSLDLQGRGEQELTGAIARTPQAPLLNPAQFFVSPDQQQQAESAAALYGSAPNPYAAAQAAMQAARAGAGGRGVGGYSVGGGSGGSPFGAGAGAYARQPFASDLQTTFASGPSGTTDLNNLYENAPAWQNWANSLPGMDPNAGLSGGIDDYLYSMGLGGGGGGGGASDAQMQELYGMLPGGDGGGEGE